MSGITRVAIIPLPAEAARVTVAAHGASVEGGWVRLGASLLWSHRPLKQRMLGAESSDKLRQNSDEPSGCHCVGWLPSRRLPKQHCSPAIASTAPHGASAEGG